MGTIINDRKLIFFLFCLANISISFSFAALAAAVPVMSLDLAVQDTMVSQVSAYYMIPYGMGALIYAPLATRFSFQNILVGCMAIYAMMNFLSAISTSIGLILVARVVMGLAAASVVPLCLISIGTIFPKEVRGRLVGLFFSTSFIASVLGIVVSGICHWRWLFVIPGLMGSLTAMSLMFSAGALSEKDQLAPVNYLNVLSRPQIRNVLVFIFAMSFLYHGVHKWLGVYLNREYSLSQFLISFYFVLIAVFGAVGQNLGGLLTDKKGRYVACHRGVIILSVATMLLVGKYPLVILGLILAAFSIGWTIGHNGISTVLTDFPDENRAEVAGLNSAVRFLSGGLGFIVGAPFIEKHFGLTFLGFGVLMYLTSFVIKRIIPQEKLG